MNRTFVVFTLLACAIAFATPAPLIAAPTAPIAPGDVIFTEFFDGWHKLDPETGVVTLLPWPAPPGSTSSIQFDTDEAVLFDNELDEIFRLNPTTGVVSSLGVSGLNIIDGFIVKPNGDLLISHGREISQFSRSTGLTTTLKAGVFFSPGGIAQSTEGRVFITEFFENILEINAHTGAASGVTRADLTLPRLIEVRSDGDLVVDNFMPRVLYRIDPDTGAVTLFTDDLPTFVRDIALDAADNLWLTSTEGVFLYDSAGGPKTLIHDETFFSPNAVAIVPLDFVPPRVPEPTSVALMASLGFLAARRRRRRESLPSFACLRNLGAAE